MLTIDSLIDRYVLLLCINEKNKKIESTGDKYPMQ